MPENRRKRLSRVVEAVASALVFVDVALLIVPVLWLGGRVQDERARTNELARQVLNDQQRLTRLIKLKEAQPETQSQLDFFLREHVPQRRQGYSRAARLVRQLAEHSGLEVAGINYKMDAPPEGSLDRLAMTINVQGPFAGLLNFAHALETASDFIVVRDFSIQNVEGKTLALRLSADLYLTP